MKIVLALLVIVSCFIIFMAVLNDNFQEDTPTPIQPGISACTLEVMECPDGSFVGRTGPNCEFEACP